MYFTHILNDMCVAPSFPCVVCANVYTYQWLYTNTQFLYSKNIKCLLRNSKSYENSSNIYVDVSKDIDFTVDGVWIQFHWLWEKIVCACFWYVCMSFGGGMGWVDLILHLMCWREYANHIIIWIYNISKLHIYLRR